MAIENFPDLATAAAAGYCIDLGGGKYAKGGDELPREQYAEIFKAIVGIWPMDDSNPFVLPDHRDHLLRKWEAK